MKKLFFSMFVAVVTLTLWSCGSANTPSAVAEKAVKCIQEAEEDGWSMLSDKGLCCYQCLPKYSIPTTFLRPPKFVGLGKSCNDIGLHIEY